MYRDAPEATGDEADDADLDVPKIYERVRIYSNCAFISLSFVTDLITELVGSSFTMVSDLRFLA